MASVKINDSLKQDLKKECINELDDIPMKDVVEALVEGFLKEQIEVGIR